jgi:hypothetical protein
MINFNKPTNPPAFPSSVDDGETVKYMLGMSVRDYFAAKAMQGLIHHFDFGTFRDDPERLALWAYDAADAMLKAREA